VVVKKDPKIRMAATRRTLFLRSKMETNPSKTNSFSDIKSRSIFQKAGGQNFRLGSHEIEADGNLMGSLTLNHGVEVPTYIILIFSKFQLTQDSRFFHKLRLKRDIRSKKIRS
jgi:hypothetical protein